MRPRRFKLLPFFAALAYAWLWNCQQPDTVDPDHVLLSVKVDDSYEAFDTLWVGVVSGTDTAVLFDDSLHSPEQLLHRPVNHAPAGEVRVIIRGRRKGATVYEEERVFNLGSKTLLSSEVNLDLDHNVSLPPVLKLLSIDTPVSAGDTLRLRVQMDDPDGIIASYSWYFDGEASPVSATASPGKAHVDTAAKWVFTAEGVKNVVLVAEDNTGRKGKLAFAVPVEAGGLPRVKLAFADTAISIGDTLSIAAEISDPDGFVHFYAWDFEGRGVYGPNLGVDKSLENVTGTHAYRDTGTFWAALRAVDDTKRAAVGKARVRVLLDPPRVSAGADKSVLTGSQVTLQGSAKDSLGRVISYAWKIGSADFAVASGPQITFTAPAKEDSLRCILKAVDDDGNAVEDTAYVTVVFPSQAFLSSLRPSPGRLSPAFDPLTAKYVDTLPYGSDSLDLFLHAENPNSAVNVAGKDLPKGDTAARVSTKTSPLLIQVVSPDGKDHRQYEVSLAFRKSGDASLKSLAVSAGKLSPDFVPGTYLYDLTLDSAVTALSLTPAAGDPAAASIRVDNKAVLSGGVAGPLPLSGAKDTIFVQVTAQDGSSHTYEVRVARALASGTALAALTTSAGDLGFQSATHAYAITVGLDVKTVTFTPTLKDTLATLRLGGIVIPSGKPTPADTLKEGESIFTFSVKAQNGDTSQYVVRVNRGANRNADIAGILLNLYSRAHGKHTVDLTASLAGADFIDSVEVGDTLFDIQIVAADSKTRIDFDFKNLSPDSASPTHPIKMGDNSFSLVATPEDTTAKKVYSLRIHRGVGFERLYGGNYDSFGKKLLLSKSGGYICVGNTVIPKVTAHVLRTDTLGDTLWVHDYPNSLSEADVALELAGGNILIGGKCASSAGLCLVMTDAQGLEKWTKQIPGTEINDLLQTSDGGFIYTGSIDRKRVANDYDLFVGRVNSAGDSLWTKTFDGPWIETGRGIAPSGSGYFLFAFVHSGATPDSIAGHLREIDDTGKYVGGRPASSGEGIAFRKTSDGGYIIAGILPGTQDAYLSKVDSAGDPTWNKYFGGVFHMIPNSIEQTSDGGYVVGGVNSGANPKAACLTKFDKFGDVEWSKSFGDRAAYGLSAVQDLSGGYALLGYTYPPTGAQTNFFLIKTDAQGNAK
jgi:hypothetical protein